MRQFFNGQRFRQVGANVIEQRCKTPVRAFHLEQRRELRLAAWAPVIHDELLRRLPRELLAEIVGNQRERDSRYTFDED